jgi:drug/metabolite transporter (DMT)-like permease
MLITFGHMLYVMMIVYVCVTRLPIVNVNICLNLGPLFTVLLAVPFLKEQISNFEVATACTSFVGVCLIIIGAVTT